MPKNSISFSYANLPEPPEISGNTWSPREFKEANRFITGLVERFIKADQTSLETWLPEYFIQELIRKTPIDKELSPEYLTKERRRDWYLLLNSFRKDGRISGKTIDSKTAERYYVEYIGNKLLIDNERYAKMSRKDIDNEMYPYLTSALEFCRDFHKDMKIPDALKSQSYDTIHNATSVYSLLELYNQYYEVYRRKYARSKGKLKDSEEEISSASMRKLNFAMFEITRIMVILKNLLMWEQGQGNHLIKEDNELLVGKILKRSTDQKQYISDISEASDNPFYFRTDTQRVRWEKNKGNYSFETVEDTDDEEDDIGDTNIVELDSITLQGKLRNTDEHKTEVHILHIGFRGSKDGKRGVEKRQRKRLTSMEEVLDKKGFQFVVGKESDKMRLIKLLENELSTLRSGWLEPPEDVSNPFTDKDYHCMKGTLLVPHQHQDIKRKLEDLLDDSSIDDGEIAVLKEMIKRKPYTIPVEIQIFTLEEYIKAEYDKESKVYHGHYVEKQKRELIPIFYPEEVYGKKSIENLYYIKKLVQEKVASFISNISSASTP